jgi:predicted TPR repeat methyltransferase
MDFFVNTIQTQSWQEARALILKGDYKQAFIILESLVQSLFHPELWLDYAQLLIINKQLDKASFFIQQVLNKKPDLMRAYSLQAHIDYKKGFYQEALKTYRLILAKNPYDISCMINAAYCLCQLKNFKDALYYFQESEKFLETPTSAWLQNYAMALLFSQQPLQAINYFERALVFYPHDSQLCFHLGLSFDLIHQLEQASFYYQQAIINEPFLLSAHHNLAILHYRQQQYDIAIKHLEIIAQHDPSNTIASTLLAAYRGDTLETLSPFFIQSLFDQYAFNYDEHLKNTLEYNAPSVARSLLYAASALPLNAGAVLDLGCGTGLMGVVMRDIATELIGVDLSAGMLQQAEKTAIYNKLIEMNVIDYLKNQSSRFLYITAIELFNYLGLQVQELIALVAQSLQEDGWFIFTAELSDRDIELNKHARYSYSEAYLHTLLIQHRFSIALTKQAALRLQDDEDVPGLYIVAQLKK